MQSQPLMTLKQAAQALGLDKSTIRQKLSSGEIKGERRSVRGKEKWFVHAAQVENLLGSAPAELHEKMGRTSTDGLTDFFDRDPRTRLAPFVEIESDETPEPAVQELNQSHLDQFLQSLTQEFARRLADERQTILKLQQEIQAKDHLLRRLPDIESTLRTEQAQIHDKDRQIEKLTDRVNSLEHQLVTRRQPWWRRLFCPSAC